MRGSCCLLLVFAASCTCGREISGSACDSSNPCAQSTFSQAAGKCVDVPVTDGTSCDAGLECMVSSCAAGICVGTPVSCDDQNACTQDSCVEGQGCQHTPVVCGGDNPCQVYACNPSSGCYDTGASVPDGTQCQLWWEPCVDDATCTGGECDSPTADSETPGQIRWQVPLVSAIGPFTVDDGGTSTFLADPDETGGWQVFAIDACGKVLWTSNTGLNLHEVMQDETQTIVSGDNGAHPFILGLEPASGAVRWSIDLDNAFDAGCLGSQELGESNQGQIFEALDCAPGFGLAAVDHQGHPEWMRAAPFGTGTRPAIDSFGNVSLLGTNRDVCDGGTVSTPLLWTVSPQGETLRTQPLPLSPTPYTCEPLASFWGGVAIGTSGVVAEPAYTGLVVVDGGGPVEYLEGFGFVASFDGGEIASLSTVSAQVLINPRIPTPIVGATGDILFPGIPGKDQPAGGISAIAQNGEVRWTSTAITLGGLILADDGTVFGLQAPENETPVSVVALDADAGALEWSAVIPQAVVIYDFDELALTPGASLLTTTDTGAIAIFAGKHRPSTTAPWSRWGGDNSNRSSAR